MDYGWPSLRNWTAVAAALMAAALAAGCGDETGVLVEVTRDPSNTPEDIETLEFVIGTHGPADTLDIHVKDRSSITEVSVSGRDLRSSPYSLLLRNGGGAGTTIMVAVIARKGGQPVGFDAFTAPQGFIEGQVLKHTLTLTRDPSFEVTATGCYGWIDDETGRQHIASPDDRDCDGDRAGPADCNDNDPNVGTSQTEICDNGIDDNCVNLIDEETDNDHDLYTNCMNDCDDNDPDVHPDGIEVCDGKDNDCSDFCDDGPTLDFDEDGYNTCGGKILDDGSCPMLFAPDCADADPAVHPGVVETCNGIDDDCDGTCDVGPGIDKDMDGFTDCGTVPGTAVGQACLGQQPQLTDCKDEDPNVNPGEAEICDGKDTNCDTLLHLAEPCYAIDPVGGACRLGTRGCEDDGSDGNFGLEDCVVGGGDAQVPAGFCAAYQTCEQTTPPPDDLFACANEAQVNGSIEVSCSLFHVGFTLCPERQARLPESQQASTCSFALLGGKTQAHYLVGLFDPEGGGAQAVVSKCAVDFGVTDKRDFLPRPDVVYIGYDDELIEPLVNRVTITPKLVTSCPLQGLVCTFP